MGFSITTAFHSFGSSDFLPVGVGISKVLPRLHYELQGFRHGTRSHCTAASPTEPRPLPNCHNVLQLQVVCSGNLLLVTRPSPHYKRDGSIIREESHDNAIADSSAYNMAKMAASSRSPLKRSLLLSTVFAFALFTTGSFAADSTTTSDDSTATTTAATTSSDDGTTTTSMPALSTSTTAASDMPSLSSTTNAADTSVPTYPAATVPPTSNAPYMQTSSMPDGTVFIAVGAILGAFGLAILLWRAIIACQLHRSVEKAAMAQHLANDKATFPLPPAPFYKYSDHDSAPNVGSGRGVRRTTRGPIPSSTPSQTNLFFSPTAAPTANPRDSVYRDNPNRDSSYRDSRFLPAGFYAAGQASPQNVDGVNDSSISLNNLRPESRGHARGLSSSDSPGFGPQRAPAGRDISSSSVNLNAAGEGRAPSAYLNDLLADQPEMFPPAENPSMPPNSNHPYRQNGRF